MKRLPLAALLALLLIPGSAVGQHHKWVATSQKSLWYGGPLRQWLHQLKRHMPQGRERLHHVGGRLT